MRAVRGALDFAIGAANNGKGCSSLRRPNSGHSGNRKTRHLLVPNNKIPREGKLRRQLRDDPRSKSIRTTVGKKR